MAFYSVGQEVLYFISQPVGCIKKVLCWCVGVPQLLSGSCQFCVAEIHVLNKELEFKKEVQL